MNTPIPDEKIDEIFSLYEKYGNENYIGEAISQQEHMLQAAELAYINNDGIEMVLANLFHDIGHLLAFIDNTIETNHLGAKDHEKIGALYLRKNGFPEIIPELVEKHVKAKKYLSFKNPDYIKTLSDASKQTLEEQGGIMSAEEAKEFEKDPLFEKSIKTRRYDEMAKEVNYPTRPLSFYKELCKEYLKNLKK